MLDRHYLRAVFDEDSLSYVPVYAQWIEGEPDVEYYLTAVERDDKTGALEGGLEKRWQDEDGVSHSLFFAFAEYKDEAAFDSDMARIRQEARTAAVQENVDELLSLIDIVKERAVTNGYADDTLYDLEGLFDDGPEDAYTLHDPGDDPRLHHHVEREDECWFFAVAPVVDTERQPLGWGLFAVHLPDLTSGASEADCKNASRASVLLLDPHPDKRDAMMAERGFMVFMETERLEDPSYAFMDDTEVLECAARTVRRDESTSAELWQEYNGQALQDFLNGTTPAVCPREKWQPDAKPLVDRFFEEHPLPIWLEDQVLAALDEQAGVEPDDAEQSPWQSLNLE